jgi:hypothetical protein
MKGPLKEFKSNMYKKLQYFVTGALATFIVYGGILKVLEEPKIPSSPNSVHMFDVNSDGAEDIIIEDSDGFRSVFLGNKNGRYTRLEELEYLEGSRTRSEIQDRRDSINKNLDRYFEREVKK